MNYPDLSKEDALKLDKLKKTFDTYGHKLLGYPLNTDFDYTKLFHFFNYSVNNVGDPFTGDDIYNVHSHELEREVVDFFAELSIEN